MLTPMEKLACTDTAHLCEKIAWGLWDDVLAEIAAADLVLFGGRGRVQKAIREREAVVAGGAGGGEE